MVVWDNTRKIINSCLISNWYPYLLFKYISVLIFGIACSHTYLTIKAENFIMF